MSWGIWFLALSGAVSPLSKEGALKCWSYDRAVIFRHPKESSSKTLCTQPQGRLSIGKGSLNLKPVLVWVTSVTRLQVESYAFFFIYPGKLLKASSAQGRSLTTARLQKASARCYTGSRGSSGLVGPSFLRQLLPVSQNKGKAPPGMKGVGLGTVGRVQTFQIQ